MKVPLDMNAVIGEHDLLFVTLDRRPSGDYEPIAESTLQGMLVVVGGSS